MNNSSDKKEQTPNNVRENKLEKPTGENTNSSEEIVELEDLSEGFELLDDKVKKTSDAPVEQSEKKKSSNILGAEEAVSDAPNDLCS